MSESTLYRFRKGRSDKTANLSALNEDKLLAVLNRLRREMSIPGFEAGTQEPFESDRPVDAPGGKWPTIFIDSALISKLKPGEGLEVTIRPSRSPGE